MDANSIEVAARWKLEDAMRGHVIEQAELMGTYQKQH